MSASALVAALVCVEVVTRWVDGYPLRLRLVVERTSMRRPSVASGKWLDPRDASSYVDRLPVAPGVDRAWFADDPAPPPAIPIEPAMIRRYRAHPDFDISSEYEWNYEYVHRAACGSTNSLPILAHTADLFTFDPIDRNPYPAYRFLRHMHYPSGLTTNNFGWRGPDVAVNKPRDTVRIAFVGASTTIDPHGDRFSYPEYIGRWLGDWARARHGGMRFEAINAGREGVDSHSIAAVVEQELIPVRPDLVVYYEGSNQFWPGDLVHGTPPVHPTQVAKPERLLFRYSAIAVRGRDLWNAAREGREPEKPAFRVDWPAGVDELTPDVDSGKLPLQLPAIVRDLDRMRNALDSYGGTLIPSSFVWLVHDGLVLDRRRDAGLYGYLNESFWPFSYALMRRLIAFQNRVFQRYAASRALPFNDLAATYPADPRLFLDAIHMTPAGIKLKAWLVFQQLVPVLERRLADGRLPLPDAGGRTHHPAFDGRPRVVPTPEFFAHCGQ